MADRIYKVPLRREFQKAPKHKRAKKAVVALKSFLIRHMKVSSIKLSKKLNEEVWKNGMKNPPHHVKVEVDKLDDTTAEARLFGEKEEIKEDNKKNKKSMNKKETKKETEEIKEEADNLDGKVETIDAKIQEYSDTKINNDGKKSDEKSTKETNKEDINKNRDNNSDNTKSSNIEESSDETMKNSSGTKEDSGAKSPENK
jgi:large subunit ribosomal protein L31e